MKIFIRLLAINFGLVVIMSFIMPHSIVFPKEHMTLFDWILMVWIFLSLLGSFMLLIYLFYHWGMSSFLIKKYKILWFLILLLGSPIYFIGPIAYYILVYEMKKGLKIEKSCEQI